MIKNECEIIKDLLPSYIEELATKSTKEFVEEHVNTCEPCKETLKSLKKEKEQEKQKEEQKGKFEINHLKKYHKEIEKLKTALFTIAIVLILICITILGKLVYNQISISKMEREGEKIMAMIKNVKFSTEYWIENEDYELTIEKKNTYGSQEIETYVYRRLDGIFFEKCEIKYEANVRYSYKRYLFKDERTLKGMEEFSYSSIGLCEMTMDDIEKNVITCYGFTQIANPYQAGQIEIREEEWNGQKCYVLHRIEDGHHYELWIEKETNLIIRDISRLNDGTIGEEKNYIWKKENISKDNIFEDKSVEEMKNKYYELTQRTSQVKQLIETTYPNTRNLLESENYTLTINNKEVQEGKIEENEKIYKVKNKKYTMTRNDDDTIEYGFIEGDIIKILQVKKDGKLATTFSMGGMKRTIETGYYNLDEGNFSLYSISKFDLREEEYNGQKCYVLDDGETKIWINKENKIIQGSSWITFGINETENCEHEVTYTLEIGNVKDEDLLKENTIEEAIEVFKQ